MPKILLVANTDWYLYNYRLALAGYLRQRGLEVVVVSPRGRFVPHLHQSGFRWVEWNVGRQTVAPWKELAALIRLAGIYRRERPTLVHHFTVKPVLYGSLVARLLHVEGVVNAITGLGYLFIGRELKARLIRRCVVALYRRLFFRQKTALIFENDADRQFFIREGFTPPERAWLIEGVGVDADYFTPAPEPEGTPLVVLPARMLWDKGVGTFVEAARLLRSDLSVRLALVGVPDPGNPASIDETTLNNWQAEGVVEWWGWRDDMRTVYQGCHIVTLPSFGEGIPTALLEAAACGRALVASDVPGCRDVVQDGVNGLLVPPNDPKALADALRLLIVDPDRRSTMGAAGRQVVLERFTNQQVNASTFAVYRTILPTL